MLWRRRRKKASVFDGKRWEYMKPVGSYITPKTRRRDSQHPWWSFQSLFLLELSTAFDTVGHSFLLEICSSLGFQTVLSPGFSLSSVAAPSSSPWLVPHHLPGLCLEFQGSVLGPLLSSLTHPPDNYIHSHGFCETIYTLMAAACISSDQIAPLNFSLT